MLGDSGVVVWFVALMVMRLGLDRRSSEEDNATVNNPNYIFNH